MVLPTFRFSGRTYPQLAQIVRELCAVAGRWCLPLVAAVAVTVAVSPGRDAFARLPPGVRLVTARTVEGMAPYPGQARCLALGFWTECFRRLNVKGGQRPFPKETRSALDIEGKHVTIQGPSPDLTSSGSPRPSASRASWQAGLYKECPRVTVTTPGRPPHRARSGHDPLIRSNGRTVRNRPLLVTCWADVPCLSFAVDS